MDDPLEACRDAHAAMVATAWPHARALDPEEILKALAYPIVIDGRSVFDPVAMHDAGPRYHAIGRPSPAR